MWQKNVEQSCFRSIDALKNIQKPLEPNVSDGDEVLVLTDTDHDPEVWKLIASAVKELGGEPIISLFPTRKMDYYNPPNSTQKQMLTVDVIITCTTKSMLHSTACKEAMENGIPIITMDGGLTLDMLTTGAATADYKNIERIEYEIGKKIFEGGKEAHLTCPNGSDLYIDIQDRVFLYREPDPNTPPLEVYEKRPGFRAVVFPRGEFNVPPNPDDANGTVVFDTTMHHLGKLDNPIEISITDGNIEDINGGYQAQQLEKLLERYGDEHSYRMPTEFSVGANPEARVTGCQREDKNILGSVHIGLGTNADVGGDIQSNLHMDGVISQPTLYIDEELKIDQGNILPITV